MKEMHVNDIGFAGLMARWCYQSDPTLGKSGGRTSDDPHRSTIVASMEPFRSKSWFSNFKQDWKKQKYFKHAAPLLSRV